MVVDGGHSATRRSRRLLVRDWSPMPTGSASHENATTLVGAADGQQLALYGFGKAAERWQSFLMARQTPHWR